MTSWVRLWHDMPTDPKFRTIARIAKQPLPSVVAVFTYLLTDASANERERGRTTANDEDIASAFDMSESDVASIKKAMQGRVMDGDMLSGWSKRQPKKEDNSAERAKAWRAQKQAEAQEERRRTIANAEERPDAEVETDAESNKDVATAPSLPERPSSKKPVSTKAEDVLNELRKVLDEDRARAIFEHRKGFKAKFTAYAAKLLAGKFAKCPDPNAAADTMIANGWQGFEVDWMERHTNRVGRLGRAQQKPSERYDPFKALAQEMQDEQNGRDSSSSGDWDDAEGVPILTIDYDGR